MNIVLTVDGTTREVSVRSVDRLVDILRDRFGERGIAADCRSGTCGRCLAFMDGVLIFTCMVPAFRARGTDILTMDGFSSTDRCADIREGFSEAGLVTCGFCDNAKIMATEDLLARDPMPSPERILRQMDAVRCRCTDPQTLVEGVKAAARIRAARKYRRAGQ